MEISTVRKSTKLIIDGTLYNTEEVEFMKPGKGRSVYRLKLRNLNTGNTVERTYRSGEKVEDAQLNTQDAQYLYREADHFVFMNTETFDQLSISEAMMGDKAGYLKDGMLVQLLMMGDEPIDITLPITVDLKVVETEISSKTATITAQAKSSVMETGIKVDTPSFVKEGDIIRVDTRTGNYVERVSTAK
jgi:elongation factor P